MSDAAIYSAIVGVAIVMLVASYRSLSWRPLSRPANLFLLLVVIAATWQLLTRGGPLSLEEGLLLVLCGMVGLVVGFVWGQAAPIRYDARARDAICRRGGFLIFAWAAVALAITVLHTAPTRFAPGWTVGLTAVLMLLTTSFLISTLTLFIRIGGVRREREF